LVRKCLGAHEIATVQTTAIDRDSGLIRLTTTLVHASGEWVSSDWPVCPVSETAAPHRLGAALTYARRYALFTLVGIAGEDDLDAPDLPAATLSAEAQNGLLTPGERAGEGDQPGMASKPGRALQTAGRRARAEKAKPPTLPPEASEKLREQLISELAQLSEPQALASWAQRVLPMKNQVSAADAQRLEAAFAAKLGELGDVTAAPQVQSRDVNGDGSHRLDAGSGTEAVIAIKKPVRERDRDHLRFVASQPCLVCGRTPSDAHHVKFAEQRAMASKVGDRFTVPICRLHHRELHRLGNERAWWENQGIDPLTVAAGLWERTHTVAPLETDTSLNGTHLKSDPGVQHQNNETKPIIGPGAG
jgi:hypothetical protein